MLTKIRLENFQGHKDSEIEFIPGVNTIIGTSDHGKSSIIRGIRWVNENRPKGSNNVSHWIVTQKGSLTAKSAATLETIEGRKIERSRGPGTENKYLIDDEELKAFGSLVPEDVEEILSISELNFQKQEDSFFLLNASSGEIMRKINKFVDLEHIDAVLTAADSDMRRTRSSLKHEEATLEDTKAKLQPFEVIDHLEELIDKADMIASEISFDKETVTGITNLVAKVKEKDAQIRALGNISSVARKVDKAEKTQAHIEELQSTLRDLENTVSRYNSLDRSIPEIPKNAERLLNKAIETEKEIQEKEDRVVEIESYISKYKKHQDAVDALTIANAGKEVTRLVKAAEEIENTVNKKSQISKTIEEYEKTKGNYTELKKYIRKTEAEFKKLMPEVCPLCGSDLEGCKHAG